MKGVHSSGLCGRRCSQSRSGKVLGGRSSKGSEPRVAPLGMVAVVAGGTGVDWGQEVVLRVEVALEVALEEGEVAPPVVVEALSALSLCLLANCP